MVPACNPDDIRRLRLNVDCAIRQSIDPDELAYMLRNLARSAPQESEDFSFAHRHLALLHIDKRPWLAALSARHVVTQRPDDDASWALLGLSYTTMGYHRAAVDAYRRALALVPTDPWYAHNLGHLLDVCLDRPADGVRLLALALRKRPRERDIAASFAHALGRLGRIEEARRVLRRYMKNGGSADHRALMEWLDRGAPSRRSQEPVCIRAKASLSFSGSRKRVNPVPEN